MKQLEYRSIKKQLYAALAIIATLTIATVLVANLTAKQLSNSYQRAAVEFVPLMQSISNLQSISANLKSELFALKSKQDSGNTLLHIDRVKSHWKKIEDIDRELAQSPLLEVQRIDLKSRNQRIEQYIVHTDHLAQLFISRSQVINHKKLITPQAIALLRNTEVQLLPQMGILTDRLEKMISSKDHGNSDQHYHSHKSAETALNDVRNFFNIYKRALLLAELLVEASTLEDVRELNRIKRQVHNLANGIERYSNSEAGQKANLAALAWLEQAKSLYTGTVSVFNIQLAYIRTEKVIDSLISQQVETADELLVSSEQVRGYLQDMLSFEANSSESNLEQKQVILWIIAAFGVVFSGLIGWIFLHRQVVNRITDIRTNMIELSYGNTDLAVKRRYRDELGDMEDALQLLQGYVEQVQTMATTDPLTKLNNRHLFDSTLALELKRSQRKKQPLALLILDIDYFKQYNDLYGHPEGDDAIVDIAQILSASCNGERDFVARIGGEEFAALLPNTSASQAQSIARQIQHSVADLRRKHQGSDLSPYLTVSIGIRISHPDSNLSSDQLYSQADSALYKAKETRNSVVID
ncbi:GGDEF domain-containing protein [Vibrio sonorensis]|uniref:GGDEF domain-containing protein n=1 Tax=Vibrio sonorensis TaxID=1004316 RepID=UPI0008D9956C|nr:GGDEF domain-containing protein [Vibrio sonorensis]